jgi:hypothetical protein
MEFIERIFGFSPDGGSGAFEILVFVIPIVGFYLLYRFRPFRPAEATEIAFSRSDAASDSWPLLVERVEQRDPHTGANTRR